VDSFDLFRFQEPLQQLNLSKLMVKRSAKGLKKRSKTVEVRNPIIRRFYHTSRWHISRASAFPLLQHFRTVAKSGAAGKIMSDHKTSGGVSPETGKISPFLSRGAEVQRAWKLVKPDLTTF
jgi:hypothetical protein